MRDKCRHPIRGHDKANSDGLTMCVTDSDTSVDEPSATAFALFNDTEECSAGVGSAAVGDVLGMLLGIETVAELTELVRVDAASANSTAPTASGDRVDVISTPRDVSGGTPVVDPSLRGPNGTSTSRDKSTD